MKSMVPVVEQLRDAGRLGEIVVIHLGTNGDLSDDTVDRVLRSPGRCAAGARAHRLAPGKNWIAPNNAKLTALPAQFPNVKVLYWDGLAPDCQGDCFYGDGIHLKHRRRRTTTRN